MVWRQPLVTSLAIGMLLVAGSGTGSTEQPNVPPGISKYEVETWDVAGMERAAAAGHLALTLHGQTYQLSVKRVHVVAPDARIREWDENGLRRTVDPATLAPTYQGIVEGSPGSMVALTFMNNGVSGFVYDSEWIDFQPLGDFDKTAATGQHVVFRSRDVKWDFSPEGEAGGGGHLGARASSPLAGLAEGPGVQVSNKRLWSYVDYEFYNHYCPGGGFCTEYNSQLSNIMNRVNAIYQNYVGFSITIYNTDACTTAQCDQNNNLAATNAGTLVTNFRTWMNNNYCCGYDIAHLWSYKNFDGSTIGQAYAIPSRYAVTQHQSEGNYDASDYQRGILVSHEMGHDFDAYHQYAESWFDIWCWCTKYTIMWSPWQGGSMAEKFSNTNKDRIINANNNWGNVGF